MRVAGHDAVHVREIGLAAASDSTILERAAKEHRIVVTQDTDFGTLLSVSGMAGPSVVLLRLYQGEPIFQARTILANLSGIQVALETGAIVVIGDGGIRIRRLPI